MKPLFSEYRIEGYKVWKMLLLSLFLLLLFALFSGMFMFGIALSPDPTTVLGKLGKVGIFTTPLLYGVDLVVFLLALLFKSSPRRDRIVVGAVYGFEIILLLLFLFMFMAMVG